jgi:protein-tyrosine phosphatase
MMRSILFVCTANICRSPMAEGVLRKLLADAGREADFEIDSAGTHDYHVGKPPFKAAMEHAARRGYQISHLVARRVSPQDFDHFDAILAMDRANVGSLRTIAPTRCKNKIELLLDYGDLHYGKDVPDPYNREAKDFELALDMIEDGCRGLASFVTRAAAVR